jgi:carboxybiotin decarboxylase
MHFSDILHIFQGITTLISAEPAIFAGRIGLLLLGMLLVYLGKKGVLEPLLMIPMGLGMTAVNAGVLFLDPTTAGAVTEAAVAPGQQVAGTLFMAPLVQQTENLMYLMQVDFLQPFDRLFRFHGHRRFAGCGLPSGQTLLEHVLGHGR